MYCQNCGAQLLDSTKFCRKCGGKMLDSQPMMQQQKKAKKSTAKRLWMWFLLVVVIIGIVNGCTAQKQPETEDPAIKPTANPTPVPTPEPVYALGDTVKVHNLEFTVNSFTFSRSAGGLGNLNPSGSDYVYCVIYVTVYNQTNEEQRLVKNMFMGAGIPDYSTDFVYDSEYSYSSSYADYTDFLFANETILPLATLSNKILNYKVPNEVQTSGKPITLKISYSADEYAVWKLR